MAQNHLHSLAGKRYKPLQRDQDQNWNNSSYNYHSGDTGKKELSGNNGTAEKGKL